MSEAEEDRVSVDVSAVPTTNGIHNDHSPVSSSPKKSVRMSDTSSDLLSESLRLLDMKSSVPATLRAYSPPPLLKSRSASPDSGAFSAASSSIRYPKATPRFKRIDFDDRLEGLCDDRKPAWKTWQDSVKDSYYKAKKTVERNKDESEFLESTLSRSEKKKSRAESPFRHLDRDSGFVSSIRHSSSCMMPSLSDRSRYASSSSNLVSAGGSGPYAAPAVRSSQGIESSRYEKRANDLEAALLRTAPLPAYMKTITTREFRNAPNPSAGSASEQDDYDFSRYCPRPYYSRPNRDDPDYFDFDLQHSVDLYRKPEGKYTPRGPQEWETKLLAEANAKGSAPLSGYMFTKGDSDWRSNGTSYLSAALRTPKFWEQRFENLSKEVRDSNPVSLDSINRNRQVPNRFTEYRDPDHDDYIDPKEDDDY